VPDITSQNVSNAILKLIGVRALPALLANLVMGNLVNRDYEPEMGNTGDVINVTIPPVLIANNIAEGGTVQTQNPSLGNAQITLNTHVEASFQIPDVTKVLAYPDLMDVYMKPAVNAVATKVESDLLNLWPLFTANPQLGATSAMDESRIDAAETQLFVNDVPQADPKFLVISANAAGSMRQISRFTEAQTIGPDQKGDAILSAYMPGGSPGLFGKIKDFFVFRSQLVALSTNYKNIAFHRNAIGLVMRRLPTPLPGTGAIAEYIELGNFGFRILLSYQPGTLASQVTVDGLYGCGPLRNNHAVVVQST
jgi:hypothetical protein